MSNHAIEYLNREYNRTHKDIDRTINHIDSLQQEVKILISDLERYKEHSASIMNAIKLINHNDHLPTRLEGSD